MDLERFVVDIVQSGEGTDAAARDTFIPALESAWSGRSFVAWIEWTSRMGSAVIPRSVSSLCAGIRSRDSTVSIRSEPTVRLDESIRWGLPSSRNAHGDHE